jgi:small subunit ribosomal protein S9
MELRNRKKSRSRAREPDTGGTARRIRRIRNVKEQILAGTNLAYGTGRRKTAVARVYLRQGKGAVSVNGRSLEEYFPLEHQRQRLVFPLRVTDNEQSYDILIKVRGGGVSGQTDACAHGIARALAELDESNHTSLRSNGLLTRDSRMKERKKYGQRGARRRFQFSKR